MAARSVQTMTFLATGRAARPALPFTSWRRIGFAVSIVLALLTFGTLAVQGLNLGLDFTGGVSIEAALGRPADAAALADLRGRLSAEGVGAAEAQAVDDGASVLIRLGVDPAAGTSAGAAAADAVERALGPSAEIRSREVVGPKVSGELLRSGALASLLAVLGIAIYVWLRFEARYGFAAFLTTLHDVVMTVGLYAVTRLSFDLTSVAALLAIAGYSINDTVVVFDRIRETIGLRGVEALPAVIDRAVTDTLRRTLMTSGTTLAATISLMIFGGPVLFGFAAAVTFGIVIGTLSSIFVAAPLLLHLPGAISAPKASADEQAKNLVEADGTFRP